MGKREDRRSARLYSVGWLLVAMCSLFMGSLVSIPSCVSTPYTYSFPVCPAQPCLFLLSCCPLPRLALLCSLTKPSLYHSVPYLNLHSPCSFPCILTLILHSPSLPSLSLPRNYLIHRNVSCRLHRGRN